VNHCFTTLKAIFPIAKPISEMYIPGAIKALNVAVFAAFTS